MRRKNKIALSILAGLSCIGMAQAALVGEWNFDGMNLTNSGTTGTNHNGVTSGTAVYTTDTPTGSGYALDLSGSAGFMTVMNSSTNDAAYLNTFDAVTDFSVSMWAKSPTGAWGSWEELGGKGTEGSNVGWALRGKNFADTVNGGIRATFYNSGSARDYYPFVNLANQLWHLVTFTYDSTASELSLYIDGELMETATNQTYYAASGHTLIFDTREGDTSRSANFMYDDIQFYDSVLTSNEVAGMYLEQTELDINVEQISFSIASPETTGTGTLELSFQSSITNAEVAVNVSISDETHAGAFTALTATPLVLTNQSETADINFEFDNGVASLTDGQTATGLVTVAWNIVGDAVINEVLIPYDVTYTIPVLATYDEVVLDNDFGEEPDTGPGFVQRQAGGTGGTTDPDTGYFKTGSKLNSLYGLDSDTGLDITDTPLSSGIVVEWTVATATANNPGYNGLRFRVSDTNNASNLGIAVLSPSYGDMQFIEGSTATPLGAATPSSDSMADGFTITLTVNDDDTWSAYSTGLSANFSSSGSITAGTYANLSSNLMVTAYYQGSYQSCTLDHLTVGVITSEEEPPVLSVSGSSMVWKTTSEKTYQIQSRESLTADAWTFYTNITSTPPETSFELPVDEGNAQFFRVVVP